MKNRTSAILWLLPALAAMLLWQLAGGSRVGTADPAAGARMGGFSATEGGPLGAFRWAGPEASVRLPAGGLPGVLELRGAVAPGAQVQVQLGGAPPVSIAAPAAAPQLRRYAMLLPARPDALGWAELRLAGAPPARIDGRDLSIALVEARIIPVARGPRLPPPGLWLALGLLPALLGLALWSAGLPARPAGWACAVGGLALALAWARRPEAIDPLLLDLQAFVAAGPLWRWWLLAQLAGLAAWPLLRACCGGLPLAGYPIARALGLLLVGWLAWLGAATGLAPFGAASVVGAWAIVAVAGWLLRDLARPQYAAYLQALRWHRRRARGPDRAAQPPAPPAPDALESPAPPVGVGSESVHKPDRRLPHHAAVRPSALAGGGQGASPVPERVEGARSRRARASTARPERPLLRPLIGWELLFIAGLLLGCALRWHGAVGPALTGTEKPMELAILSAVLRSDRFPPLDPWLAGYGLNYYYLGYVIIGALAAVAGTEAPVAFNIGFALIVALTVVGVAYLASALVGRSGPEDGGAEGQAVTGAGGHGDSAPQRDRPRPARGASGPRRAWPPLRVAPAARGASAALLALILTLAVGSQISALQLLGGTPLVRALDAGQLSELLAQRLGGAAAIRLSRPTPPSWDGPPFAQIVPGAAPSFDWFLPSRGLYDDVALPAGGVERRYAITEFPAFSLYLGDLHPHVLAMPFNLLALALALAIIGGRGPADGAGRAGAALDRASLHAPASYLRSALAGFLVGCLYCINAWDAPTYGLLLAGALALGMRREATRPWPAVRLPHVGRLGGALVARGALLAACALLAALPFLRTFVPPAGPPVDSPLAGLPLIGRLAATLGLAANRTQLHSFLILFGLFLLPILWGLGGEWRAPGVRRWPLRPGPWSLALAIPVGLLIGFPLLFLLPLAGLLARRAWRAPAARPGAALAAWMAAVGALILLVPELVYIRDQLEGEMSRMITIFKFVFQAWLLWGIAAAYAATRPATDDRQGGDPLAPPGAIGYRLSAIGYLLFAVLLIGALLYPVGLLRWAAPWRAGERTLDGLAYLAREAPDELAAARWLAASLAPDQVLLTGFCNCDYELVSRVGAISGAQTLLGWMDGHERVWRSGAPAQLAEIARRERDIPLIYAGDPQQALVLLRSYGVDYVYIGPVERRLYGESIALAEALPVAFRQGAVLVLQVGAR